MERIVLGKGEEVGMALYSAQDFTRLLGTPGFSDALLTQHFELYRGYVKNANALHDELEAATPGKSPAPYWSELKRRFGWEWNGLRLHEMYFGNLTKSRPSLGKRGLPRGRGLGSRDSPLRGRPRAGSRLGARVIWHGGCNLEEGPS